jgi:hypothetical protein
MNMRLLKLLCVSIAFMSLNVTAQDQNQEEERKSGHTNQNKFKQLYDEFSTPNMFRTGSGAPGPAYYQQQADYKMDLEINDETAVLSGYETITYTNNSPDELTYLWVQLDQNVRTKDSPSDAINSSRVTPAQSTSRFASTYMSEPFDGGFNIESVTSVEGKALVHMINQTMMRVELPKAMKTGDKFSFNIKWWYQINNHVTDGGRSGYELFPDGNRNYVIAQFYPRMAVYNDVEGWQLAVLGS